MDQTDPNEAKTGPALSADVQELQGHFPTDAALQDALSRLALLGFDRADFSVPDADEVAADTPEQGAAAAPTPLDNIQLRTMASGLTGSTAGMVAGAAALATGIAAPLVAVVAGASALGAVAATTGIGVTTDQAGIADRDRLGATGKLVLAVRLRPSIPMDSAAEAMRQAGATEIVQVERAEQALTRGVSATSWTGD